MITVYLWLIKTNIYMNKYIIQNTTANVLWTIWAVKTHKLSERPKYKPTASNISFWLIYNHILFHVNGNNTTSTLHRWHYRFSPKSKRLREPGRTNKHDPLLAFLKIMTKCLSNITENSPCHSRNTHREQSAKHFRMRKVLGERHACVVVIAAVM